MNLRLCLFVLGTILLLAGILTLLFCPPLWLIGLGVAITGFIVLIIAKLLPNLHCHKKLLYHVLTVLGLVLILLGALVLAISPVIILGLTLIAVGILLLEIGLFFIID